MLKYHTNWWNYSLFTQVNWCAVLLKTHSNTKPRYNNLWIMNFDCLFVLQFASESLLLFPRELIVWNDLNDKIVCLILFYFKFSNWSCVRKIVAQTKFKRSNNAELFIRFNVKKCKLCTFLSAKLFCYFVCYHFNNCFK